jgi:hypothetical protein
MWSYLLAYYLSSLLSGQLANKTLMEGLVGAQKARKCMPHAIACYDRLT